MAMGSTGTVNITPEMMTNAKAAVSTYRETLTGLQQRLQGVVDGLIPSGFSGSAANGFKTFHTNKIDTDLFVNGILPLLETIDSICDGILKALPDAEGVDEQLAAGNQQ